MTEIGLTDYYTLSFKDTETINTKGHLEGFLTEIFIKDKNKGNLLLHGEGWGKLLRRKTKKYFEINFFQIESKISACFSVVDKYIQIVDENEKERELHSIKVKKYTKDLLELIGKIVELADVAHSIANSTVYMTQL